MYLIFIQHDSQHLLVVFYFNKFKNMNINYVFMIKYSVIIEKDNIYNI